MPVPLAEGLARVRALIVDPELVRAVGAGRRRGATGEESPERVDLRLVDLATGTHLQVVARAGARVATRNVPIADEAALARVLDDTLTQPFANWHVETETTTLQLRVTKRGAAQVHSAATSRRGVEARPARRAHDRAKHRLIDPDDPLFAVLGADADKRRQVDAFLRLLDPTVRKAFPDDRPLRVVDLGCGNAYLTMAAHRFLSERRPGTVTVGVEVRADLVARSTQRAQAAGLDGLRFVEGAIAAADPGLGGIDVVLALHACDTATDEALARALGWQAPVILAAPCCHHDIQRQLADQRGAPGPAPYRQITTHPILRERLADVLTDALRAGVLRQHGYRVDVVEFVDSRHTPRNAMIRARRTRVGPTPEQVAAHDDLCTQWQITPALTTMLAHRAPSTDPMPEPALTTGSTDARP